MLTTSPSQAHCDKHRGHKRQKSEHDLCSHGVYSLERGGKRHSDNHSKKCTGESGCRKSGGKEQGSMHNVIRKPDLHWAIRGGFSEEVVLEPNSEK